MNSKGFSSSGNVETVIIDSGACDSVTNDKHFFNTVNVACKVQELKVLSYVLSQVLVVENEHMTCKSDYLKLVWGILNRFTGKKPVKSFYRLPSQIIFDRSKKIKWKLSKIGKNCVFE